MLGGHSTFHQNQEGIDDEDGNVAVDAGGGTWRRDRSRRGEAASGDEWTVPVLVTFSKITRLGPFPFSVGAGAGYFLEKPDGGPQWKLRTVFTLILPGRSEEEVRS